MRLCVFYHVSFLVFFALQEVVEIPGSARTSSEEGGEVHDVSVCEIDSSFPFIFVYFMCSLVSLVSAHLGQPVEALRRYTTA